MTEPKVTVQYVPSYEAHLRQGLLAYICARGAIHQPALFHEWPDHICPVCTYYAADVVTGVPWPCPEEAS